MRKLGIHSCLYVWVLFTGCAAEEQNGGVIQIEAPVDRPVLNAEPPPNSTPMDGADLPTIQTDPQGNLTDEATPEQACQTDQRRACGSMCGQQSCTDGQWSDCMSTLERCNAHDDDCDGQTDEGLGLGMNCTDRLDNGCTGLGTLACNLETGAVECQVADTTPTPERCDGLDNDCDGTPDEDFPNRRCCTEAYHCPPRAQCIANECVGGATTGGNNGAPGGSEGAGLGERCVSSFDCILGLTCADGTCRGVCFFDEDCPADQLCACPANDPNCILTICRDVPPQDGRASCQAPQQINALGLYMANTNGAPNDLTSSCGNRGIGPDLVFQLMLPDTQIISVDTSGSSFDTVLTARTQCNDANSEMACDDDGGNGTTSRLTMQVQAGQIYFITVHGYGLNSAGAVMIEIASAEAAPGNPNVDGLCENTCAFADDGACDDGGPDAAFSVCEFGTDCADCGPR